MMRVVLLLAFALSACGNVERPLAYVDADDPTWQLAPDPGGPGTNTIARSPVQGSGRIKSGL